MCRMSSVMLLLFSWSTGLTWAQGLETTATKDDWEEVNFEFDSAILSDGYPSLLRLSELLSKNPAFKVRLDGNTDWVGSEKYNEKLGMARANTVKSFLIKYGARAEQIEVVTRGKKSPKVDNRTKEGRFINRRVVMTVMDAQGRIITAGGVGDAIRAISEQPKAAAMSEDCCKEILKRLDKLDDILAALKDLKSENASLRQELDALKKDQAGLRAKVEGTPPPLTRPEVAEITRSAVSESVEQSRMKRFSLLGLNLGADSDKNVTFTGAGRYFAPFKENFAFQAQGEYLYFRDRQEGQFDFGLVNRYRNMQAGLFSSFKHVNLSEFKQGGTLGQAAITVDYLFRQGRVGLFGAKGFLDNVVVNRAIISRNVVNETYLKLVDQIGGSTALGLYGNSYVEANLGFLRSRVENKPGGTIRFVQPINDRWAFTLEGGFNETLIAQDHNGRVVAGLQFGNFIRPKEFVDLKHPVPADIPRVRYELLTRRVRTGNDSPVADAGPDQIGVNAGTISLDGSGSFDPDGDPITFQWSQIAGPAVSLAGMTTARASFPAAEGQSYAFRLTVKDDHGAQGIARVSVTTTTAPGVQIVRFQANPAVIRAGQTSAIVWQVLNADEVTITGLGRVDSKGGTSNVAPTETTVYRITARNRTSEANESITITVERPEVRILGFSANPGSIRAGESSTLAWSTENADTVTISGIGSVARNGTSSVSPTETTTYTLTARNNYGEVSATATVQVAAGEAPRIISFQAVPTNILSGESSRLSWQTENADQVTLSGVGNVQASGDSVVSPPQTTSYVLTATNKFGSSTATVTVQVTGGQAPRILSFTGSPLEINSGQQSTLSWGVDNADEVTITSLGKVALSGTSPVSPTQTTSYILVARNRFGEASATVTITVNQAATITACVATPALSAKPGDPVVLSWVAQNATQVTISGLGPVALAGPVTVRPTADTTYTVTALSPRGQATCQISVKVTQPPVVPPTVVIAGAPVIETIYRQVVLDASQSTDPEGGPLTYSWRSLHTSAAILDPTSATPRVQLGQMYGDYIFEVTVTNSKGVSATSTVTVRLKVTRVL